jgi:hypothetical protein
MTECVYCKKTYANPYILKNHLRTSKPCILKQEEVGISVPKKVFECLYCHKVLANKDNLKKHHVICKKKTHTVSNALENSLETEINTELKRKDEQLKEKEEHEREMQLKIKELEEKLKQKEKTPTKIKTQNKINNQTNTTIGTQNNITIYQVMTPEHVLDVFKKHYKLDTLLGGQKALARFVNEGFLKENATPVYTCGDRSRQKFYILHEGKKVEDTNCEGLIELTSPGFLHVQDVYEEAMFNDAEAKEEEIHSTYQDIMNISSDHQEFNAELSRVVATENEPKPLHWKQLLRQMKERNDKLFSDVGKKE